MLTGSSGAPWERVAVGLRTAVRISARRLDHITSRAMGISAAGALLVRPDCVPLSLWTAHNPAVDTLAEVVVSLIAPDVAWRNPVAAHEPRTAA